MTLAADDPRHGTTTGYCYHRCRCDECREAWRLYRLDYSRRHGVRPTPNTNYRLAGTTTEERLLLNHTVSPEGCWRWKGAHATTGYGCLGTQYVHRLAYELWVGPIADGLHIDHVAAKGCAHRDCLNPAHLEPVTQAENNRRALEVTPRKTHCKHGHEFTPENTYVSPAGARNCRECKREHCRADYWRKRDAS